MRLFDSVCLRRRREAETKPARWRRQWRRSEPFPAPRRVVIAATVFLRRRRRTGAVLFVARDLAAMKIYSPQLQYTSKTAK